MHLFKKSTVVAIFSFPLCFGCVLFAEQAWATHCDVVMSEPTLHLGRVMHPGVSAGSAPHDAYAIAARTVSVNVGCSEETGLALVVRGNALGERFRFARGGHVAVRMSNAQVDGRSVELATVGSAAEVPSHSAASVEVKPGNRIVPMAAGVIARGTVMTVQVDIRPHVPLHELRGREETSLDSHLQFEVETH
jgi:hypothetical protein